MKVQWFLFAVFQYLDLCESNLNNTCFEILSKLQSLRGKIFFLQSSKVAFCNLKGNFCSSGCHYSGFWFRMFFRTIIIQSTAEHNVIKHFRGESPFLVPWWCTVAWEVVGSFPVPAHYYLLQRAQEFLSRQISWKTNSKRNYIYEIIIFTSLNIISVAFCGILWHSLLFGK